MSFPWSSRCYKGVPGGFLGFLMGFRGFPRSSMGFPWSSRCYQGVPGGFLGFLMGFRGFPRGFRWLLCLWIDILKNTSDLLTNEAKSRDAVASKIVLLANLYDFVQKFTKV